MLFNEEIQVKEKPNRRISGKTQQKRIDAKVNRKAAAKEIIEAFGFNPTPNTYQNVFTSGQSNAGGFYEAYRDHYGYIDELVLATWIISRDYALMIEGDLKSGRLGSLVMVVSDRMKQLPNKKATYNYIVSHYPEIESAKFKVLNSHAKTYGMKIGNTYINVDGSGNWSENPRIENYILSENKEAYEFRKNTLLEYMGNG